MFLFVGSSFGAFVALWRLAMSFSPDPRFVEGFTGYLDVPMIAEKQDFAELLLAHERQLQRIALTYEKSRRNLSSIGITVAIASLAVPVATWTFILLDAFKAKEPMPNAWLLVASSTTSGALGLAIAVTLLRHLKNNQKPAAEVSERLLACIETGMAMNAIDAPPELKAKVKELAVTSFIKSPSQIQKIEEKEEEPSEQDKKLLSGLLSLLTKRGPESL